MNKRELDLLDQMDEDEDYEIGVKTKMYERGSKDIGKFKVKEPYELRHHKVKKSKSNQKREVS